MVPRYADTIMRTKEYNPTPEQYEKDLAAWKVKKAEYESKRDTAMAEAGVKPGDRVEWHCLGAFNTVEVFTGTLYIAKSGQPKVKLDAGGTRGWHKGFTKV